MIDLSIVVPIFNVQDYLEACLASVEAALLPAFTAEVLCIDDGSTDSSGQIAQSFATRDSRFRVITQVNGGYGKAINTGMRAARGRFVTIVDPTT
ncbi:glycosyltransferase [Paracoccus cavernae]|uniref:Glycosyltransferase n=1 Tax=Paracoccus cavernae TaxID=1571207 RepID=A0ABT8DEM4_9RHOB|nr:glycosyltransferase [Paracoccus cavernae]